MPAIEVMETTFVDRPVDEVFDYISDCENDVKWCSAVQEVRHTAGTPGAVGATYFMRHTPGGMKFDAEVRVVEVDAPRHLRWVMTDGHSRIHGTYHLVPEGSGTRLVQTSEVDFRKLWRIPGFLMNGYIKKDMQKNLKEQFALLRKVLEGSRSTV